MDILKTVSTLVLIGITFNAFSQNRNWKTESSKDGKVTVKYETVAEDEGRHFYYIAEHIANTSIDELDTYLSNSSNHKNFLEATPISEEVKRISDSEWITYYFFDAPWPMSDSEVVVKFIRANKDNKLVYTANVISSDYKKSDVRRLTTYKFIYELERINANTTKIIISADYIPGGSVPEFLVNTWFPEGPANIISRVGLRK